ncbi:MAG TPA: S1 RNA-binding domain-containing protein [Pseudonocardiaceae bacterium]|nr:S1 RNA-binding domain-containing protein [Pseudonocardiaceae bacterium]
MFNPTRTVGPEPDKIMFAMPFDVKTLRTGEQFDFTAFYHDVCVPLVRDDCGMEPVRVDGIYGTQGVLDSVWRAMQQAGIVVVDFTACSANVALEFGWALLLGKRIVLITQEPEDIPTDVRGLYRYLTYSKDYQAMNHMRTELELQLKAVSKELAQEMAPMPMQNTSVTSVPARVIFADTDYLVVQDDRGRRGVLGNGDVDYARVINDMRRKYPIGSVLDGAFAVDPIRGDMRYSLLCGQSDPWPALVRNFPPGKPFHSRVENVNERAGVFVRLENGVNGLVPADQFGSALPAIGTEVEVSVTRIDEQRRRVSLRLLKVAAGQTRVASDSATQGWEGYGSVVKAVPERDGRGGFLLLRLPNVTRPAMMLVRDMSEDLRADLNDGQVEFGEEILVKVIEVNPARERTLLRELPEPDETEEEQPKE